MEKTVGDTRMGDIEDVTGMLSFQPAEVVLKLKEPAGPVKVAVVYSLRFSSACHPTPRFEI